MSPPPLPVCCSLHSVSLKSYWLPRKTKEREIKSNRIALEKSLVAAPWSRRYNKLKRTEQSWNDQPSEHFQIHSLDFSLEFKGFSLKFKTD